MFSHTDESNFNLFKMTPDETFLAFGKKLKISSQKNDSFDFWREKKITPNGRKFTVPKKCIT